MFSSLIVGGFVAQKSTVSISEAMGRWAIALQGGAGDISTSMTGEKKKVAEEALHECLDIGVSALENSASALDVVEKVVSALLSTLCFRSSKCRTHKTIFSRFLGFLKIMIDFFSEA
jgi:hypothetical protein